MAVDLILDVQVADDRWGALGADAEAVCRPFIEHALSDGRAPEGTVEVSVVLSGDAHVADLNQAYRGREGATNVLSFALWQDGEPGPSPAPGLPVGLGDIVLAFDTVAREADAQGKTLADHTAHLLVHGALHLLGFDHQTQSDAEHMESLERTILSRLSVADPYSEAVPQTEPAEPASL